jgi:hypothetical protein
MNQAPHHTGRHHRLKSLGQGTGIEFAHPACQFEKFAGPHRTGSQALQNQPRRLTQLRGGGANLSHISIEFPLAKGNADRPSGLEVHARRDFVGIELVGPMPGSVNDQPSE